MKFRSRYKRLNFWNKLAFWGAIASLIALLLWVYECQSDRILEQKYLPVRETVVSAVFESYKSINHASEIIISPQRISSSVEISPKQKSLICKWSIDPVKYDLNKAENLIIRNNSALDPETMSSVSSFIDEAKILQKQLTFFAELHNPYSKECDFVSTGPFSRFSTLEKIINDLTLMYPQITFGKNLKSSAELEEIWSEEDKKNNRLCFDVKRYKWNPDRLPLVFDTSDLIQLDLPLSAHAYVYDLNE